MSRHFGRIASAFSVVALSVLALVHLAQSCAEGDPPFADYSKQFAKTLPDRQKDVLTDWIVTFQVQDPKATQHALEVWRKDRESIPWLLAVFSKTEANSP
jgi:hypothetical protein